MPGKLGKNLRSGHLAEDIGILFLRNFCAVATIRQEEGLFFAEDSFLVQIKSSSITEIKYSGDEIKWLLNQDLPFFLCTVNKKEQQISIYTTNPIYQIILHPEVESIKLVFEDLPDENHDRIKVEGSYASFLLGPPIIKASEGYSRTD